MKYTVTINQKELAESALDFKDAAILDWIATICASINPKIDQERKNGFTWCDLSALMRGLPMLRIKAKSAVSTRIRGIAEDGWIETMLDDGDRLYVRMTAKYEKIVFDFDGLKKKRGGYKGNRSPKQTEDTPTVRKGERNRSAKRTLPFVNTNQLDKYDSTSKDSSLAQTKKNPSQIAKEFFSGVEDLIEKRENEDMKGFLVEMVTSSGLPKAEIWGHIKEFWGYWTELDKLGKQQRWQKEGTFMVDRRLQTWLKRAYHREFAGVKKFAETSKYQAESIAM